MPFMVKVQLEIVDPEDGLYVDTLYLTDLCQPIEFEELGHALELVTDHTRIREHMTRSMEPSYPLNCSTYRILAAQLIYVEEREIAHHEKKKKA